MRKLMRWRYYCEFCKKSGASGGHIAKHEASCTRNPNRVCRMCAKGELVQQPMETLLAALHEGGADAVLRLAEGCPACTMAAILVHRGSEPLEYEESTGYTNFIEFDYKKAADSFWADVNEEARSWANAG